MTPRHTGYPTVPQACSGIAFSNTGRHLALTHSCSACACQSDRELSPFSLDAFLYVRFSPFPSVSPRWTELAQPRRSRSIKSRRCSQRYQRAWALQVSPFLVLFIRSSRAVYLVKNGRWLDVC